MGTHRVTIDFAGEVIAGFVTEEVAEVKHEFKRRAFLAANELRNASLLVLRGQRTGRIYRLPYGRGTYQASAPGEAPAVRTGTLRQSFVPSTSAEEKGKTLVMNSHIKTTVPYADWLEKGTKRMARRPYVDRTREMAKPEARRIYKRPYTR